MLCSPPPLRALAGLYTDPPMLSCCVQDRCLGGTGGGVGGLHGRRCTLPVSLGIPRRPAAALHRTLPLSALHDGLRAQEGKKRCAQAGQDAGIQAEEARGQGDQEDEAEKGAQGEARKGQRRRQRNGCHLGWRRRGRGRERERGRCDDARHGRCQDAGPQEESHHPQHRGHEPGADTTTAINEELTLCVWRRRHVQ